MSISAWERVLSLLANLESRGQRQDARALLRELRDLHHRRWPRHLASVRQAFEDDYLDLRARVGASRRSDADAPRQPGHRSDPTPRMAAAALQLDAVDSDLIDIWNRHREAITGDAPSSRRRVHVWRAEDEDEQPTTAGGPA